MKKLILSLLVVTAFVAAPVSLFAQDPTATETATGSASIVSVISIAKDANLNFGIISNGPNGGSVSVNAADAAVATEDGDLSVISTSGISAAAFTVTGQVGASYAITSDANFILENGSSSMNATLSTNKATGTLDGITGEDVFYVGGVLTVASGQETGAYSGTFDVAVNYN